jgi:nicotinate-nucleotide adenylyltransferase
VLRLATVAVAERERWERDRVREALDGLAGSENVVFFEMPRIDVSSSLVRQRAGEGLPVRYFVPDLVAEEIAERGLYSRDAVGASS